MSLVLPTPGSGGTPGPLWATMLNTVFNLLDAHTHRVGSGQLITTAALNINSDLTFAGFNLTNLKSARLASNGSILSSPSDLQCVYSGPSGNLYYNNAAGTAVQITSGAGIYAAGVITNVFPTQAISNNLTILATDTYTMVAVTTGGGAISVALPLAASVTAGRYYIIADVDGNAWTNAVTINRAGSDLIDGATSFVMGTKYGKVTLISDGVSNWRVETSYNWANTIINQPVLLLSSNTISIGNALAAAISINCGSTISIGANTTGTGITIGGGGANKISLSGSITNTTRTVAGSLTVDTTTTDSVLLVNTAAPRSITLPAPTNGRRIRIVDISGNAGTNNITLIRNGSESINGIAASRVLASNFGQYDVVSDGTNWWIST